MTMKGTTSHHLNFVFFVLISVLAVNCNAKECETYEFKADDGVTYTERFCKSDDKLDKYDLFELSLPLKDSKFGDKFPAQPPIIASWEKAEEESPGSTRNLAVKKNPILFWCPEGPGNLSICKAECAKMATGLFVSCDYKVTECNQKPTTEGCLTFGSCEFFNCKNIWERIGDALPGGI